MASTDWIEVYDSYTPAELTAEIAALKQRNTGFAAQSSPSGKSYQAIDVSSQLAAAIRVQTNRANAGNRVGVADFSRMAEDARSGGNLDAGRQF